MKKRRDRGRTVVCKRKVKKGLSLLLAAAAAGASLIMPVSAEESTVALVAVAPLVATPVEEQPTGNYVNTYLGFSRTELVRYLVTHAEEYLSTPYGNDPDAAPVVGEDGGMQCEGFVWSALFQVARKNRADVPFGSDAKTEPLGNGGGWVDWAYTHDIQPMAFDSKEEMLNSGILQKGDIIWSFDVNGPYGLSNRNHVGFFWGDTPDDDKMWHSGQIGVGHVYEGSAEGNRITEIVSVADSPSVWWVFHLSPDRRYRPVAWRGKPHILKDAVEEKTEKEIVFFDNGF